MANDYFNPGFTEVIPDGSTGNQAYEGIFFENGNGRFQRLTEAEGHEVSLNPETEEKNTIGMKSAKTVVKSFKESFSKNVIIEKGSGNYEFFKDFQVKNYTGRNAIVRVMMVDMMESVPGSVAGHQKYRAYTNQYTVTVESANYTDAQLNVSFGQAGEKVLGVAEIVDDTEFPVFVPQSDIPISAVKTGASSVELEAGKDAMVSVAFAPFGCSDDFTVESDDGDVCKAERIRQSVRISGIGTGETVVAVKSADGTAETEINVLVA